MVKHFLDANLIIFLISFNIKAEKNIRGDICLKNGSDRALLTVQSVLNENKRL